MNHLCVVIVACAASCSQGPRTERPQPPITFDVENIRSGSGRRQGDALDVRAHNTGDVEVACYFLKITYHDANRPVPTRADGTAIVRNYERMSLGGADAVCAPRQTCRFTVTGLTIPSGTTSATVEATKLLGYNATRTDCADTPLYDARSGAS